MNLQSEIEYFSEVLPVDQARLLAVFLHELAVEARSTYGPGVEQVHDGARLRFVNEIVCRLAGFIEQLLADERADRDLDDWLKDQRNRIRIDYVDKDLAPPGAPK